MLNTKNSFTELGILNSYLALVISKAGGNRFSSTGDCLTRGPTPVASVCAQLTHN